MDNTPIERIELRKLFWKWLDDTTSIEHRADGLLPNGGHEFFPDIEDLFERVASALSAPTQATEDTWAWAEEFILGFSPYADITASNVQNLLDEFARAITANVTPAPTQRSLDTISAEDVELIEKASQEPAVPNPKMVAAHRRARELFAPAQLPVRSAEVENALATALLYENGVYQPNQDAEALKVLAAYIAHLEASAAQPTALREALELATTTLETALWRLAVIGQMHSIDDYTDKKAADRCMSEATKAHTYLSPVMKKLNAALNPPTEQQKEDTM